MKLQPQWIKGKTVSAVVTSRKHNNHGGVEHSIDRIEFTDGSYVWFLAKETDAGDEMIITAMYCPPSLKGGAK